MYTTSKIIIIKNADKYFYIIDMLKMIFLERYFYLKIICTF